MPKTTFELLEELQNSDSVQAFVQVNKGNLCVPQFSEHIEQLLKEKCLEKAYIANNAGIERTYVYQLLSGRRKPSRDNVVAIALCLKLTLEQTQYLLKYSNLRELYVRDIRDSLLVHAINKRYDVLQTNSLLESQKQPML